MYIVSACHLLFRSLKEDNLIFVFLSLARQFFISLKRIKYVMHKVECNHNNDWQCFMRVVYRKKDPDESLLAKKSILPAL